MVLLGADERRLSRPRAGAARTLLLPVAALDSGPGPEPLPSAAPEGQARKPQQCVGGGGVRPRLGTAGGRGRPRRDDHPGDGESHAARLRDRRRCGDAAGPGAGDSSLQPSARIRAPPDRAAVDARRARGPGDRIGGGDDPDDAPGAGVRQALRGGGRVSAAWDRGGDVLGLQARAGDGRRGPRVPRGQRVRRGIHPAPPVPGGAAQFHLGRLGQRHLSRRAARAAVGTTGGRRSGGPTLVFLHEGLGSLDLWRDFPRRVSEATGLPAFVYSRAGYGKSNPAPLPRPVRYMHDEAALLPDLLKAAGIDDPVLVGHSDGASISIIHAGSGGKARALVLEAPHVFTEEMGLRSIAKAREAYESGDLRTRLAKYHP